MHFSNRTRHQVKASTPAGLSGLIAPCRWKSKPDQDGLFGPLAVFFKPFTIALFPGIVFSSSYNPKNQQQADMIQIEQLTSRKNVA
jgi:hypothetical protein